MIIFWLGGFCMDGFDFGEFFINGSIIDFRVVVLLECLIKNLIEMGSVEVIIMGGGSDVGDGILLDFSYFGMGGLGSSCVVCFIYEICIMFKNEGIYCRDSFIFVFC